MSRSVTARPRVAAGQASRTIKVPHAVVARARVKGGGPAAAHPFTVPLHPPAATPGERGIAQDEAISSTFAWAQASAVHEGQQFLGYAYLSELAQRPEYRTISERLAQHMTRKWIRLQSVGQDNKADKIKAIEAEMRRLRVQDAFRTVAEQDGFFGRGHLYIDTGAEDDPSELRTDIGDGRDATSRRKIGMGTIKALRPVEAVWCYPTGYNSNDPLREDWYRPSIWHVMGREVHASRLLTFIGREVPDMLKPAYSFGGLSMSQIAKPYVDNWLRTRQSVADIVSTFSVMVFRTKLAAYLNDGGQGDDLFRRLDLFNALRDNRGIFAIDKELEDFTNVSAPLSGLDVLQAQTQEHMAAVSGIPTVILLGLQPAGLNASSEGELQAFYDHVHSLQERLFRTNLGRVLGFVQLSLFGEVDPDITFEFEPLRSLDEKERADVRLVEAQTDATYIDAGVLQPAEVRARIASDESSPYSGLDVDDMPLPPAGESDPPPADPAALRQGDPETI